MMKFLLVQQYASLLHLGASPLHLGHARDPEQFPCTRAQPGAGVQGVLKSPPFENLMHTNLYRHLMKKVSKNPLQYLLRRLCPCCRRVIGDGVED